MDLKNHLEPRKKPSQKRSKETVEVILKAAVQVFEQNGYNTTTTNHIANRAGVSIGTLYQYFPHKDAILYELLKQHIRKMAALVEKLLISVESERDFSLDATAIRNYIKMMVSLHENEAIHHRFVLEKVPLAQRSIAKWIKTTEVKMAQLFEKILIKSPNVRKKNTKVASLIFVQVINSMIHRFVLYGHKHTSKDDFITEVTDLLHRYLFTS